MNLFGKKKDEKEMVKEQSGCCCGGNCNEESVEAAKETLSSGANVKVLGDRKSTRLNSSHTQKSRMPSSA